MTGMCDRGSAAEDVSWFHFSAPICYECALRLRDTLSRNPLGEALFGNKAEHSLNRL